MQRVLFFDTITGVAKRTTANFVEEHEVVFKEHLINTQAPLLGGGNLTINRTLTFNYDTDVFEMSGTALSVRNIKSTSDGKVLIGKSIANAGSAEFQVFSATRGPADFERETTSTSGNPFTMALVAKSTNNLTAAFGPTLYFTVEAPNFTRSVVATIAGMYDSVDTSQGQIVFNTGNNNATRMRIRANGAVMVGKFSGLTGAGDLDVAGSINSDAGISATTRVVAGITLANAFTNVPIQGVSTDNVAGYFTREVAATSGYQNVIGIKAKSSGTMVDGFGPAMAFVHEGVGVSAVVGGMVSTARDGSNSAHRLEFSSNTTVRMRIRNSGAVQIGKLGGLNSAGDLDVAGRINTDGGILTEGWIAPTLYYSWVNYSAVANPVGYYKDSSGRVFLRGVVKSGTMNQMLLLLPGGYRPEFQETFIVISNGAIGRIDISAGGVVTPMSGSNLWISLDGISFRAFS